MSNASGSRTSRREQSAQYATGSPALAEYQRPLLPIGRAHSVQLAAGAGRDIGIGPGFLGGARSSARSGASACPIHAPKVREWGLATMRAAELWQPANPHGCVR